ncbi:MAG: phosphate-binding protein [Lentisphaerae bacterium RIFOXYA12_FULL_48_11]|nr:MAG: phosphate-binding protein [Lentisphaerae bacterium RIFOXYA12_FULL_48_11]
MRKTIRNSTIVAVTGLLMAFNATADDKIVMDGSTTVGPIAKSFAEYYMKANPNVNITVSESGSGNGAKSIINGTCDIGNMSRPMKSSEKKSAKDSGVMPIEHIIAMDGIAVIVHPSNPAKGLTVAQLRDIYNGKIKSWKELGGPDSKIVVISRDTNSGTYETFETMVMNKEKMASGVEYVGSNGAIRQRVLSTENAIGYVGLAFLEGVKSLEVNNVMPSEDTVRNKTYPISRPLYMYTKGRPKEGTHLFNFINLYNTTEGKKIIADTGFVPMN